MTSLKNEFSIIAFIEGVNDVVQPVGLLFPNVLVVVWLVNGFFSSVDDDVVSRLFHLSSSLNSVPW